MRWTKLTYCARIDIVRVPFSADFYKDMELTEESIDDVRIKQSYDSHGALGLGAVSHTVLVDNGLLSIKLAGDTLLWFSR